MKAQIIRENGGPDVIQAGQLDRPTPAAGQVLVRIAASSVNTADLMARAMGPVVDFIPAPPAVLGMDFAGTVVALGPGVDRFSVGDQVYGCAGGVAHHQGTLAQYIAADVRLLAKKPTRLSMVEAAALPLVSITAYEALFDRLQLQAGATVLVHGGAGGVGHVAIQLARAAGATVFATDSGAERLATIERLGATAIDYQAESVEQYVGRLTDGAGFDLVFDTVGGANLPTSFAGVKLNGSVATTVSLGPIDLTMAHLRGASLHVIYMLIPMIHDQGTERHGEILEELARLVDSGAVQPVVDSIFPLERAADAHRQLESKTAIGKVVVDVAAEA
jgi:NADPH2:quinone reductase